MSSVSNWGVAVLLRRLAVVFLVLLLAACGRGISSTPGDAPNL